MAEFQPIRECNVGDIVRFPWDSLPDGRWRVGEVLEGNGVGDVYVPFPIDRVRRRKAHFVGDCHGRGEFTVVLDTPVEVLEAAGE